MGNRLRNATTSLRPTVCSNHTDNEIRAQLIIQDDAEAYWELAEGKEEIQAHLDRELVWLEPEETRADKERSCVLFRKDADIEDTDRWDEYQDWFMERGELIPRALLRPDSAVVTGFSSRPM